MADNDTLLGHALISGLTTAVDGEANPILVNSPFTLNAKSYDGFKVIYSAQKHLEREGQPGVTAIPSIFEKIGQSLNGRNLEADEIGLNGEKIYSLYSCTSGHIGFSTDHRSTKLKDDPTSNYMLVFHHSIRTKQQYDKNSASE